MDEKPYLLFDEARKPIPATPGHVRKEDDEYVRKETFSIMLFTEPSGGWRLWDVSERGTQQDCAEQMRIAREEHYPD